jgi:hypothetical protein
MAGGSIGIVVVTYNSAQHIGRCVDGALLSGADLVVVDNASTDGTCAEVAGRGVRLIANQRNLGFAAAVNQGFRALGTPFVLLLNPDATLLTGLDPMRECCARPDAAGAGGKLLDEAGRPQIGFMFRRFPTPRALIFEALGLNRIWPHNPVNRQFRCLGFDHDVEQPVEQPAGALLMIRRDVWEKLSGFDERFYPLWFEDVDFAARAAALGYRMYYTPRAVAKHTGAHSILQMPLEIRTHNWYLGLLRYAARHFRPWSVRGVCLGVIVGSVGRIGMGIVSQRSLKPIVAYGRVAGLAARVFLSLRVG